MKQGYRLLVAGLGVVVLAVAMALITLWGQDPVAADGTIYYVDADATSGMDNGTSWENAFLDLQPALDAALAGDQIWVAAGTYTPTAEHGGSGDRYKSFQMVNGVAIYGGFDPSVGHTEWEDRDWVAHLTILSGDIGVGGNNSDNSYHVFYHPDGTNLDSSAILDGFTITGGYANGDWPHCNGGGMYNRGSSPTLSNCTFSGNSAYDTNPMFPEGNGAGMYNVASSSPTLTSCTFSGNSASGFGGGIYSSVGFASLTDCTFSGNSAMQGGAMFNAGGQQTLANCTFAGNWAGLGGGGIYNQGSSPTLINCTFSGNSADGGGGMWNHISSPTLTNCILWGDTPEEIYNYDSTPVVTYSDIQGGYPGTGNIDAPPFFVNPENGDFHLRACSPCIDAGDNEAAHLPDYDFEGDDRIVDGDGNGTTTVDMGVDEVVDGMTCLQVYLPVVLRGY